MTQEEFTAILEKLKFFETEDEDGVVVYCYEPEENQPYLILSDELGETPKPGAVCALSCYCGRDSFLWSRELESIWDLPALHLKSGGGQAFITALQP